MKEWLENHATSVLVSLIGAIIGFAFYLGSELASLHANIERIKEDLETHSSVFQRHVFDHPPRHIKYRLNKLPAHGGP